MPRVVLLLLLFHAGGVGSRELSGPHVKPSSECLPHQCTWMRSPPEQDSTAASLTGRETEVSSMFSKSGHASLTAATCLYWTSPANQPHSRSPPPEAGSHPESLARPVSVRNRTRRNLAHAPQSIRQCRRSGLISISLCERPSCSCRGPTCALCA